MSGVTTGTQIGVQLISGDVYHAAVAAPPTGNVVSIAGYPLPSGAASGALVWVYPSTPSKTFAIRGPQPVENSVSCGTSQAYFQLGPGRNRPLLYVHPDVVTMTLSNVCFDGNRSNQTGWSGAETGAGLLETIEVADGLQQNESSVRLAYAAVTGGYNGNLYIGANRGVLWLDAAWFMYSGVSTADYQVWLNGYDGAINNVQIGLGAGTGLMVASGSQYQLHGGAIFLNSGRCMDINGGLVTYLSSVTLNCQDNGMDGIRELNTAPFASQVPVSHVFTNTTFDGNSHAASGSYSDILNTGPNSYLSFVNPQFNGNQTLGGNLPQYNVNNTSTGRVKITNPTFGNPSAAQLTTTTSASALAGATSLTLTNASSFTTGSQLDVVGATGAVYKETVAAPPSGSVVSFVPALAGAVNSGATVYNVSWTNDATKVQCSNCNIENNWTPTVYGSTTAGSATYAVQTGTWSWNNQEVTVKFKLQTSAFSGAAGSMTIGGLPKQATANAQSGYCSISNSYGVTFDSGYTQISGLVAQNAVAITLLEMGSGKAGQQMPVADFAGVMILEGVCIYNVDN